MNKTFGIIITILLYFISINQSIGQIDSVRKLDEVIVLGKTKQTISPSQNLSGALLQGLSNQSVADALRYFSGVQIKDYGGVGGLKTINVRGMGSEHVGVFYNGVRINNAQNGQVDLGRFSMDNIEEITLYNGQKSDILQPATDYASSSTIYIRSKKPIFRNKEKQQLKAGLKMGSFGVVNPSVSYMRKLSNNYSVSSNVEYLYANGKYKYRYQRADVHGNFLYDTTAVRHNGDIRAFRTELALFYNNSHCNIKTNAYLYDSERGIPGAIVNNRWLNSQRQWDRNIFIQSTYNNKISDNYEILATIKYAYDKLRYYNPDTTLRVIDNTFKQHEIYLSLANKWEIKDNLDISLSTDARGNTLTSNMAGLVFPRRYTILNALSLNYRVNDWILQPNVLYTYVLDTYRKGNNLYVRDETIKAKNRNVITASLFTSYTPKGEHRLKAHGFYKHIFRMPTFNDLYYTELGSSNLRPEYTHQYDIGVVFNSGEIKSRYINNYSFQCDIYYNDVTDKIIAVPRGSGQFRWQMMNIGRVKVIGLDLSSSLTAILFPEVYLNTKVNYSYKRAMDYTILQNPELTSVTYGGQIAYTPRHSGSILTSLRYHGWGLNYNFIYVGERFSSSDNSDDYYIQPWYTSDMVISKDISFGKSSCKVSFEINNVMDQNYEVILNYPMPGRNYKISLTYSI